MTTVAQMRADLDTLEASWKAVRTTLEAWLGGGSSEEQNAFEEVADDLIAQMDFLFAEDDDVGGVADLLDRARRLLDDMEDLQVQTDAYEAQRAQEVD